MCSISDHCHWYDILVDVTKKSIKLWFVTPFPLSLHPSGINGIVRRGNEPVCLFCYLGFMAYQPL